MLERPTPAPWLAVTGRARSRLCRVRVHGRSAVCGRGRRRRSRGLAVVRLDPRGVHDRAASRRAGGALRGSQYTGGGAPWTLGFASPEPSGTLPCSPRGDTATRTSLSGFAYRSGRSRTGCNAPTRNWVFQPGRTSLLPSEPAKSVSVTALRTPRNGLLGTSNTIIAPPRPRASNNCDPSRSRSRPLGRAAVLRMTGMPWIDPWDTTG